MDNENEYTRQITKISNKYKLKGSLEVLNIKLYNLQSELVDTQLSKLYKEGNISDETLEIYLRGSIRIKERIESEGIVFRNVINEQAYVQKYTYFEIYLQEVFTFLYTNNPKLMLSNKKANISIEEEIEHRVEKLIRNNIKDILRKLIKIISITTITSDELSVLYVISQNRNLILHKGGVVDNTYIKCIKREKIDISYKIGDIILTDLERIIETHGDILNNIEDKIYDTLFNEYKTK